MVRSGCAECGQDAGDPAVAGWIDPATGTYTPGPAPADAAPCDAGCVDTVCRTRCDDTDGDGAADATYTELWCIKSDGSAELVLTYQDDPSSPYTPTSPVDCEYGCPETETLTLCDDAGPFLRRITWLQGTATYEDVALDGVTPHVVTGTVTTCAATAEECAERTTPAATLGLCLPDGTPLAVLITRDCDGTTTQDGWLNLTTGTYTAGPPPAGAAACGDARAFELAGLLCDTDPATGDVYGLVLVEYAYNTDGSLASVRLVDPATGATYTLQGELRRCPADAGAELPEQDLTVLCDVQADGTSVPFVRDYRRDPATGQITGLTDYTLDGQPYTVTGTVGTCTPDAEPCRNTSTVLLCDEPAGAFTADVPLATLPQGPASGTLPNGVQYTVDRGQWFNADQGYGIYAEATQTWTFDQPVTVEFAVGGLSAVGECVLLPAGVNLVSLGPDHTYDPATRRLCPIAGGNTSHSTFRTSGEVQSLTWQAAGLTNMGRGLTRVSVSAALEPVQFLRQVVTDCATGAVVSVTDTTLDGQPYTVVGEVGQCQTAGGGECCPPEPCRNSSTLLVCDLPAGGTPTATVTDTDPTPYYPYPTAAPVAGAQALWDGGTLTLPPGTAPQPGTTGSVNSLAATLTAPRPACDTGTAHVTVTLTVQQTGPDNGCGQVGHLRLFTGTTQTALTVLPAGAPAGYFGTLTVEADVPAADLAAGTVAFAVALDAYDDTPSCTPSPRRTGWTLSGFTTAVTYDQDGCAVQFLRTVTVDCETGAVTGVEDTTLDGQPYTPTGEVGQCTPAGGGGTPLPEPEPCRDTSTVLLCDAAAGTETVTTTVTDATLADTSLAGMAAFPPAPAPWGPLWAGGTYVFPRDTSGAAGDGVQAYRTAVGRITGTVPDTCRDAAGEVTVSVRVRLDGPDPGVGGDGWLRVWRDGVQLAQAGVVASAPVGHVQTLQLTVPATADDLTAGRLVVGLSLETYHVPTTKSWTADQFTVTAGLTGCAVQFLRTLVTDCQTGAVIATTDTTLDGQPYTVTGEVGQCQTAGGECCPPTPPEPCPAHNVISACRCDDTDGDGIADTEYVELLAVDCEGSLTSIGAYTCDLTAPYTPVSPVPCEDDAAGAEPALGVQAGRVELAPGASWDAATVLALQSVTATAHTGTGRITTAEGTSTLFQGESATWSTQKEGDALLAGPLTITAVTGIVTVTYTRGVTL
ncbi:hypothetical protein [Streptomyces sp. NPDC006355]|uniref:hypothetical protein n=1 Tax=Streptomyces sp. NPDC006355 TaxID=3156758 RepID=UPI0033AA9F8C